jgi:hypothetical protein
MQNDVATTRYYNILIKSSQPSPAKAVEPAARRGVRPADSAATNPLPKATPPSTPPQTPRNRSQDDDLQESVALRLFDQKTTELNQLVAELESKLADAESERQTLKLQAKLVYGLVSEIKSLRAISSASLNSDNLIGVSATQERVRNRKKGRRLKEWKDSLVIACLLMSTVAATTFVMENVPQRPHSLFSLR